MADIIIKHFFIYFGCIYLYYHLLNIKVTSLSQKCMFIIAPVGLSLFTLFLRLYLPEMANILPFLLLWVILSCLSLQPKITFIATMISFGISYGTSVLIYLIFLVIIFPFRHISLLIPNILLLLLSGSIEIVFVILLFCVKKFHKGMPFLFSTKFVNSGTGICLCFFCGLTYLQLSDYFQFRFVFLISFLLFISTAALIFWWQAQLTKSYLRKLQLLELESLRKELEETSREMEHLKKQNEELGRLIHKDNKLIPAMETAVIDFLSASGQKENNTLGQSLISPLRELSGNRREILNEVSAARSHHFATGVPALDTMLTYFDRRAEARKIEFTVNVTPDLKTYVPSRISSDNITHLLADLLENAIIAVAPCTSRKIRLQIYPYRKWFVIELSDTGIPFQAKSLLQFGIQQLTTHKDSGGSGIGLMDVWKLKEKYHASIHITEYPDSSPFSKRITFLLDHRNQYLIRTWRCEELKAESRRTDLCILPPGNEISSSS